jgi:acyl-CoA hydrolase
LGTQRVYDMIDDNPMFHLDVAGYINDPHTIEKNPNMRSINSALEIDLTGQVSADTIRGRQYSGVGGQMDFAVGSHWSEGGKYIIALPSTAKKGTVSRIVPTLFPGSSVTTSRWIGATIVTEYGIADLWAADTRQRATALIKIAHPKFREELEKFAYEYYGHED